MMATLRPAIVMVPDRGVADVFEANAAVTEPAEDPLTGEISIQVESLTAAVHNPEHPAGVAVMVNVVEPPLAGIWATEVGVAEKEQLRGALAADCVMAMVVPAIASDPDLGVEPLLAV